MAILRTFVAVSISESARQALAKMVQALGSLTRNVRWVSAGNCHLTLKFLGEVDSTRLPDLKKALATGIIGIQPFSYELEGTGCFPSWRHPRVLWIGIKDAEQVLVRLQQQLESEYEKLQFPAETRRFQPHLTVGRVKDSRHLEQLLQKFREYDFGRHEVKVMQVHLFKSDLLPTGARYTLLHSASLG